MKSKSVGRSLGKDRTLPSSRPRGPRLPPAPSLARQRQPPTVRPQPVTPRRRYLRCWGGSPAPGGAASFRPGPRAVPPIPYLGTPGGWGGGWRFRRAAFRRAALGQLPPRLRRFRGDASVDTADPRASARYSPGPGGKRGTARAGGGVAWSPSNEARPGKRLCATTQRRTGAGPEACRGAGSGGSRRGAAPQLGVADGELGAGAAARCGETGSRGGL